MAKKTLTLKKPEAGMAVPVEEEAAPSDLEDANTPVAAMATLPGARMMTQARPASYTAAAVCALIAVVLLGALLALQLAEDSSYRGVIPPKSAMIPAP
jgi:hypothetical protein